MIRLFVATAMLCSIASAQSRAGVSESNVLVLWNSQNADSSAVRDLYVVAHPGVLEFDLNDATIGSGSISRVDYVSKIRTPVKNFINGDGLGPDISDQIMIIATTRGLPARINSPFGTDEFQVSSAWSSVESDLTLLQQDLEASGSIFLPFRYHGLADNPYHRAVNQPIDGFSRAGVKNSRTFTAIQTPTGPDTFIESWSVDGLTPGDIYLVCRIDSGPATFADPAAIDNIGALLTRSASGEICADQVQSLLDEYDVGVASFELDEGAFPPQLENSEDFEMASAALASLGIETHLDQSANFIEGSEIVDPTRPIAVLATYGENHSINGWGANPPGAASYLQTYDFHPSAILYNIESWSGTSMHSPGSGRNAQQAQVLEFIELGGSFAIGQVMEPFTFGAADIEMLIVNMLEHGLTFAEAAWSAIPALSWQHIPVGDPLARITILDSTSFCEGDANRDGFVNFSDITSVLINWLDEYVPGCGGAGDSNNDGFVDFSDITTVLTRWLDVCL